MFPLPYAEQARHQSKGTSTLPAMRQAEIPCHHTSTEEEHSVPERDSGISKSPDTTREKENFRPFSPPEKISIAPLLVSAETPAAFQAISSHGDQERLSLKDGDMVSHERAHILSHTSAMSKESPGETIELKAMALIPSQCRPSTDPQNVVDQSGTVYNPQLARVEVSHQVAGPPEGEEQMTTSFFSSTDDEDKNLLPHTDLKLVSTKTPPDMVLVSAAICSQKELYTIHMPLY